MGVQISDELWSDLVDYFSEDADFHDSLILHDSIRRAIRTKCDKLKRRQIFSDYKKAPSGSFEREHLRGEYLDSVGVLPDWRSDGEFHEECPF